MCSASTTLNIYTKKKNCVCRSIGTYMYRFSNNSKKVAFMCQQNYSHLRVNKHCLHKMYVINTTIQLQYCSIYAQPIIIQTCTRVLRVHWCKNATRLKQTACITFSYIYGFVINSRMYMCTTYVRFNRYRILLTYQKRLSKLKSNDLSCI